MSQPSSNTPDPDDEKATPAPPLPTPAPQDNLPTNPDGSLQYYDRFYSRRRKPGLAQPSNRASREAPYLSIALEDEIEDDFSADELQCRHQQSEHDHGPHRHEHGPQGSDQGVNEAVLDSPTQEESGTTGGGSAVGGPKFLRGIAERIRNPRRRYSRVAGTDVRTIDQRLVDSTGTAVGYQRPKMTSSDIEMGPMHVEEEPDLTEMTEMDSRSLFMMSDDQRVETESQPVEQLSTEEETGVQTGTGVIPWVFSFRYPRLLGARLGIHAALHANHAEIPQETTPTATPSPSIFGRSQDDPSTPTPPDTTPAPPTMQERLSQAWTTVQDQSSLFAQTVRERVIGPDDATPNPDDDPTHQQLIMLGGFVIGPLLFALGGILFFLTPRDFTKTRRWGLVNLALTILSFIVIATASANQPAAVLSERIETYGAQSHSTAANASIASPSGVIKVRRQGSDPWVKVPSIRWDFANASSVELWSVAKMEPLRLLREEEQERKEQERKEQERKEVLLLEGKMLLRGEEEGGGGEEMQRRLEEASKQLVYERVVLGPNTAWNLPEDVPDMQGSSGWVLGPSASSYPVPFSTISVLEKSKLNEGIVWSEPVHLLGRLFIQVDFSWGGRPSASVLEFLNTTNPAKRIQISKTATPGLVIGDLNLPLDFRGVGLRCIPKFAKKGATPLTLGGGRVLLSSSGGRELEDSSSTTSVFGHSAAMWSLLWKEHEGNDKSVIRQIVTLPNLNQAAKSVPDVEDAPVSSILAQNELAPQSTAPPWSCRVALIDTTHTIPDSRPPNNFNWISFQSVFLRPLP